MHLLHFMYVLNSGTIEIALRSIHQLCIQLVKHKNAQSDFFCNFKRKYDFVTSVLTIYFLKFPFKNNFSLNLRNLELEISHFQSREKLDVYGYNKYSKMTLVLYVEVSKSILTQKNFYSCYSQTLSAYHLSTRCLLKHQGPGL